MIFRIWFAVLLFAVNIPLSAQSLKLNVIDVEPVQLNKNLADNYSFEQHATSPNGYIWDKRNTDSTCEIDIKTAHSGTNSLKLTNKTPFGAHVYGMLTASSPIVMEAGKPYTLSAWVKSSEPGTVWIGGGNNWQFRMGIPKTGDKWQRVGMTFTPSSSDIPFVMRMITESPTTGVWIDDIKLESGSETSPVESAALDNSVQISAPISDKSIQGDGDFDVSFTLLSKKAFTGTIIASLSTPKQSIQKKVSLDTGAWRITIHGNSMSTNDSPRIVTLSLAESNGRGIKTSSSIHFYSTSSAKLRLDEIARRLPDLNAAILDIRSKEQDVSYPMVTYTVMENFIPYIQQDLDMGQIKRALMQIADIEKMADKLQASIKDATTKNKLLSVPKWTGKKRPIINSSSLLAPTKAFGQTIAQTRPVFFAGYGHFAQVVNDLEKFKDYGINIIQIETGPSATFPREGDPDLTNIKSICNILDRCEKAGVAMNLLISPHYMPDWMYAKYPELKVHRTDFFQYCTHAPEVMDLLKRHIQTIIPLIKDYPALQSICLSNEPTNAESPCEYAKAAWIKWLTANNGDIATLNSKWGTDFKSFVAAELPNPFKIEDRTNTGRWIDYIKFNQEFFAGWHKELADAVHSIAPDLPVHAKAMTWTFASESELASGVEAYMFGKFSDMNGNDAVNNYSFNSGEFVQNWQSNAAGHDMQRSVKDAPVFNSENHLIADRDTRYVPGEHVRNVLWQGAIHGQSATTIWVWERTFDPKSDFAGSIMHRPVCAEAVGIVNYDLNRAAEEVTAIQQAPSPIVLLSSTSSLANGGGHMDCINKLYTALAFTGVKTGFVTERQLEDDIVPQAQVLLIPSANYLSTKAMETLQKFRGKIVFVGSDKVLTLDEYSKPLPAIAGISRIPFTTSNSWRDIWKALLPELKNWGISPQTTLTDASNQPVWGVEWREANSANNLIVNLSNFRNDKVTLNLLRNGKPGKFINVLTGKPISSRLSLDPMEISLLRSAN